MRNLTITREKTLVACLSKMKIYIEDMYGDTIINGVNCRILGEIKNGETVSFQIQDYEAKVFVIAGKASKNICNDMYQLPYGTEDIWLSGKNKYNILNGNAFRFHNNYNQEAEAYRKKGNKKGIIVLVIAVMVGFSIGFFVLPALENKTEPKTFSHNGLTITLTDNFARDDVVGKTATFVSKDVLIYGTKEPFSSFDGFENYTLDEYADLVLRANDMSKTDFKKENGLTYIEHKYTPEGVEETYFYYTFLYKSTDSFWIVEFAVFEENAVKLKSNIFKWAETVKFQ